MTVSSSVLHQIEQILITKYVCPRTEIDTDLKTVIYSLKEHKNRAPCVIVYSSSACIHQYNAVRVLGASVAVLTLAVVVGIPCRAIGRMTVAAALRAR